MIVCRRAIIAIFGGNDVQENVLALARSLGAAVTLSGHALLTGGTPGKQQNVKNRAALGAGQGLLIAFLPKGTAEAPIIEGAQLCPLTNWTSFERNPFSARIADAAIVLEGGKGTLAEAAFALHFGKPVRFVGSFDFSGLDIDAHVISEGKRSFAMASPGSGVLRAGALTRAAAAIAAPSEVSPEWAAALVSELRTELPACLGELQLPSAMSPDLSEQVRQWSRQLELPQ